MSLFLRISRNIGVRESGILHNGKPLKSPPARSSPRRCSSAWLEHVAHTSENRCQTRRGREFKSRHRHFFRTVERSETVLDRFSPGFSQKAALEFKAHP